MFRDQFTNHVGAPVSQGTADEKKEECKSSESSGDSAFSIPRGTSIYIPIRADAVVLHAFREKQPEDSSNILVRRRFPELQAGDPFPIDSRELP